MYRSMKYTFFWTAVTNTCPITLKLGRYDRDSHDYMSTKFQGDRTSIRRCRSKNVYIIDQNIEAVLHLTAYPQQENGLFAYLETLKHVECKTSHSTPEEVLVTISCCIKLYTLVVCFTTSETKYNARCQC